MRVLILNQYTPPDPAPTAKLVADLATGLHREGHDVRIIGSSQSYRVRAKGRISRAWREAKALARMFGGALKAGPAEVVISTSSPPAILMVATLLCALRRAKSVHWALDLYPELAFALGGRLPPWLQNGLYAVTGYGYRANAKTVGVDEDMRDYLRRRYGVEAEIIRPWLLHDLSTIGAAELAYPPREGFTWLYSGNLGQAHDWETPLAAQRLLEDRGCPVTLALQGGGASWHLAQRRADQLKLAKVDWRPYVSDDRLVQTLLNAHAMLVTQKPSTQGLLWPSKLGLLMCLPRPLIFVGPEKGAIGSEIRSLSGGASFASGASTALADHIQGVYEKWPPSDPPSLRPGWTFEQAWTHWRQLLRQLGLSPCAGSRKN